MLSNEDIGFVHIGQRVDIKVDTFPFEKYGSVPGHVVAISPDAELRQSSDADRVAQANGDLYTPTKAGLVYKVRIEPEQKGVIVNGHSQLLLTGMTVVADIKTDRRRVIDFLLSPVLRNLNEGVKVR